MVKVSTLIYRVDGFNELNTLSTIPEIRNQDSDDQFLEALLSLFLLDPGEELVKSILRKI